MIDFYQLIELLFGAVWDLVKKPLTLPSPVGTTSIMSIGIFFGLLSLMVYAIQRFFGFVNDYEPEETEEERFERDVEEQIYRNDVRQHAIGRTKGWRK